MKTYRSIICMVIIMITLCTICTACNGFKSMGGIHYTAQLNSLFEWLPIFIVVSFFTGFLPVYIYECIKEMKPAKSLQEPATAPALYVGQTFTAHGCNCVLKVKSLKNTAPANWGNNLAY